jgi:8-oxo-dGTP pyrophosphatase MutT (NUDIX family)
MTSAPLPPWAIVEERQIFRDRWFDLRSYRYKTGTGAIIDPYYVAHRHDWACILALDDQDRAVTVRIWRPGTRRDSIELPGGAIDATDVSPAEAIRRELLEETGYACGDIVPVVKLATNPANHTNHMHVFAARGAHRIQAPELEPGETLVPELVPLADLKAKTLSGDIQHGLHVAAILLAIERLSA